MFRSVMTCGGRHRIRPAPGTPALSTAGRRARCTAGRCGAGLATSVLSDLDGQVGVAAQSLFIAPR